MSGGTAWAGRRTDDDPVFRIRPVDEQRDGAAVLDGAAGPGTRSPWRSPMSIDSTPRRVRSWSRISCTFGSSSG